MLTGTSILQASRVRREINDERWVARDGEEIVPLDEAEFRHRVGDIKMLLPSGIRTS
jgi:hypothetical protein